MIFVNSNKYSFNKIWKILLSVMFQTLLEGSRERNKPKLELKNNWIKILIIREHQGNYMKMQCSIMSAHASLTTSYILEVTKLPRI